MKSLREYVSESLVGGALLMAGGIVAAISLYLQHIKPNYDSKYMAKKHKEAEEEIAKLIAKYPQSCNDIILKRMQKLSRKSPFGEIDVIMEALNMKDWDIKDIDKFNKYFNELINT